MSSTAVLSPNPPSRLTIHFTFLLIICNNKIDLPPKLCPNNAILFVSTSAKLLTELIANCISRT